MYTSSAITGSSFQPGGAQAYSAFTKAAGELEMVDARDAFLSSLCEFTLSISDPQTSAELATSPSSINQGTLPATQCAMPMISSSTHKPQATLRGALIYMFNPPEILKNLLGPVQIDTTSLLLHSSNYCIVSQSCIAGTPEA